MGPLKDILRISPQKGSQRDAQGYSFEGAGGARVEKWKRLFRLHKAIVLKCGGGPERHLVQYFARNVFQHASRNDFFCDFFPI